MGLQCFLFSSDEGTAETIGQVLAGLDVQVESCPEAVLAVEMISKQAFQIVIIDWDRNRKPDCSCLLRASAKPRNGRSPLQSSAMMPASRKRCRQVRTPSCASPSSSVRLPIRFEPPAIFCAPSVIRRRRSGPNIRLWSGGRCRTVDHSSELLKRARRRLCAPENFCNLALHLPAVRSKPNRTLPVRSTNPPPNLSIRSKTWSPSPRRYAQEKTPSEEFLPPQPGETRGLEWYLKARGVTRQNTPPAPPLSSAPNAKPELLGFEQGSSVSSAAPAGISDENPFLAKPKQPTVSDQKNEAELFAYIDEGVQSRSICAVRLSLGKGAIIGALLLASCAIAAAPQAPWHPKAKLLWARGQQALHVWLNPQPVTPAQAPVSHENFGRAGDEYKLPVAESIPDATTDPSQIRVLPVIDPTAKKPPADATNPEQPPPDASTHRSDGSASDSRSSGRRDVSRRKRCRQRSQPASINAAASPLHQRHACACSCGRSGTRPRSRLQSFFLQLKSRRRFNTSPRRREKFLQA